MKVRAKEGWGHNILKNERKEQVIKIEHEIKWKLKETEKSVTYYKTWENTWRLQDNLPNAKIYG